MFGLALCIALGSYAFLTFHPVFGGKPDTESLAKIQRSPNFNGEKFVNLEETALRTTDEELNIGTWFLNKLNTPKGKRPTEALPSVPLAIDKLKNGSVAWFGHSSVLFQTGDKRFITDPVFHYASPLPFTVEPFKMQHSPTVAELPELDAVLISHDHYDHLDYKTILQIDEKTARFVVPFGVKAHLQRWGIANEKIVELD